MATKQVRRMEFLERKSARFRNHLHFTLHCKHHGVTPASLNLKSSVKGVTAERILQRAQHQLVGERIRQIYATLNNIKQQIADIDEQLFTELPMETYSEVKEWVAHAHKAEWDRCRSRQQTKFARFSSSDKQTKTRDKNRPIVPVNQQEQKEVTDRWVINKSDKELTESELSVLQKGLNYAVSPSKIPVVEFITGVESATKLIGHDSDEASRLRLDCVDILEHAKVPDSNISKEERAALRDLKSDDNIMILPADKGRATVVMNKTSYQDKANELLADKNTYELIKKDPTAKYKNRLVDQLKVLKDEEWIDFKLYRQLYPTTAVVPKFYGLPKVHKPSCPLRPIVASRGSITYDTAKFVANILSPLVGKSERHLQNSEDLVNKMSKFTLGPDECLVSFDVTALFTCVPVDESLEIVKELLSADTALDSRTDLSPQQITDLLSTCLKLLTSSTTTSFMFNARVRRWAPP
ncbi:uncharacterized protein [Amphiura filiformis]|uniref:uncharacterized protein n=1 Tax=Amphiura filiformis TaxID=82378 RepID=UPI003B217672